MRIEPFKLGFVFTALEFLLLLLICIVYLIWWAPWDEWVAIEAPTAEEEAPAPLPVSMRFLKFYF